MNEFSRRQFMKGATAVTLASLVTLLAKSQLPASPSFQIIDRKSWGAQLPQLNALVEAGLFQPDRNPNGWLEYQQPLADVLHTVIIHHTAAHFSHNPRQVQKWHMEKFGFADIGYHFLIGIWGEVYEGRSLNVRGAHTKGFNTGSIGIALTGNFEWWRPTAVQIQSLTALTQQLSETFALTNLVGHRDCQPEQTVCPGKNLWHQLPQIASALHLDYGIDSFSM